VVYRGRYNPQTGSNFQVLDAKTFLLNLLCLVPEPYEALIRYYGAASSTARRITSVDVDLARACFENGKLPPVPFVLQHGDVLEWAALLADRKLTLRSPPPEAGDPRWLKRVFRTTGNSEDLTITGDS
jgi:hypothetical protein